LNKVPDATDECPLARFAGDPAQCVPPGSDPVEDWETILNPMLKAAFGWGKPSEPDKLQAYYQKLAAKGEKGIDGFCDFFQYFFEQRGLEEVLLKEKVETLKASYQISRNRRSAPTRYRSHRCRSRSGATRDAISMLHRNSDAVPARTNSPHVVSVRPSRTPCATMELSFC